jgi:hypothetical protein
VRRNIWRRAAKRRMSAAAALAAGVLAVTGCGQTHFGAAALYDNKRISTASLAAEVSNLNASYQADKSRLQIPYTQADMPRQVLSWMLRFATTEQVAKRTGITVTPAQAQAQLAAQTVRARQSGDTLAQAAVLNGLPPDLLPELGRWIAIQLKLQSKLDHRVPPSTAAAQQALIMRVNHVQCLAAKSLHIQVNPQYGAYDYGQLSVVPAPNKLAAPPGMGKAAASPAPHLTSKC